MSAKVIWIYRIPGSECLIAKPYAFGYQVPVTNLYNGHKSFTLQQGVPMEEPAMWDWVEKRNGVTFARFNNILYDISELSRVYFMGPR
jgi:hypothetical protein